MSSDNTKTCVGFYEHFRPDEVDDLMALVHPDYVGHGLGGGGWASLRRDVQGFLAAFDNLTFTIEDTVTEGDTVSVRTTMRGTHVGPFAGAPASGNAFRVAGCDVFKLRDERIVEAWTLCDSATLFMQIGALTARNGG